MERWFEEQGAGEYDGLADEEPILASCYGAASSGQQGLRVLASRQERRLQKKRTSSAPKPLTANAHGFGVHAATTVPAGNKAQRLAFLRYLARPPLAQDNIRERHDGHVVIRFKKPWADGTQAVVMKPEAFIQRLCAAIPPPRFHLLRYHGVLAPHASRRVLVVPEPEKDANNQLALPGLEEVVEDAEPTKPKRSDWATLLARVFKIDASICPHCGGRTRIVAFVTEPHAVPRAPPDNGRQLSLLLYA